MRPRKLSLLSTITIVMSTISIVLSVLFVVLFYSSYYYFADQELKNSLIETAQMLNEEYFVYADGTLQYLQPESQVSITDLLRTRDLSAVIFSSSGERIGTFGIYRYVFESEPAAQEQIEAGVSKVLESSNPGFEHISIVDTTYEAYTTPLYADDQLIGYLQVTKQYSLLQKMKMLNFWLLVFVIPPSILIIWFVIHTLLRRFFAPFKSLTDLFLVLSVDTIPRKLRTDSPFLEIQSLVDSCNTMIDRLKNGIEAQKHFSAYASHELNTPLTRVISDLEVLEIQQPTVRVQESITELHGISALLEGLLLLIQPKKGKPKYNSNIVDIIEGMLGKSILINKKQLTVSTRYTSNPLVALHPAHTRMLVENIVGNALKYVSSKGTVAIEVVSDGEFAVLSVKNTGKGISKSQQKEIFEPFFRTSNVETIPGVGLGLSLVKQIVLYYNLKIEVKSESKEGTTVIISEIPQ